MSRSVLFNVVIPIAILLAGAGVIFALGSVQPKSRPADDESLAGRMKRLASADVSRVMMLSEIDKPLELRVDGIVVPFREVRLAAEVSGQIVRKSAACEAGSFVKQGDWMFDIDDIDYQQEVDRLTRMREQDYEALKEVDQEMANARRMVKIAGEDVVLQEREVKRLESLPGGFASQGEVDKAKKAVLTANQNRISFENQLDLMSARRSKLEATERLAATELRGAETNLKRTKIFSPIDGIVIEENAELNTFIQRGSPVVTLEDVTKAEIAVNLRMDQLHWVLDQARESSESLAAGETADKRGYSLPPTPAVVEFEVAGMSGPNHQWNGTLLRYNGIGLDPQSRTVPVVIVVDRPRGQNADSASGAANGDASAMVGSPSPLVRGMFVSVRLLIKPQTPLFAIPSLAMQPGNRVWQFVADPSVLEKPVTPLDPKGDKPATEPETQPDEFDPAKWVAGKVLVRRDIVPVDSLWLPMADDETSDRRYWICDASQMVAPAADSSDGGPWVVVTPLGDFGDVEFPVRVPAATLQSVSK